MQVSVETTAGLERKMRVVVPAGDFQGRLEERFKQTAKKARLNGFRPGKVPLKEVKRRFGDEIRQEVSMEVIQATCGKALQQQELVAAGQPKVDQVQLEEGQDMTYTVLFEVFPEVEVTSFDQIKVDRPVSKVTKADLDKMVETLRKQRSQYNPVERASQLEDKVNVNLALFIDGEAAEEGTLQDRDILLGSGEMIPGLEEGLVGLKAGQEAEVQATFPEDYREQSFAGKQGTFKVTMNAVQEPELPELDDAFFAQFDVTEGGLQAFRKEVENNMQRELDTTIKAKVKGQVMNALLEQNQVELPKSLVAQEAQRLRAQTASSVAASKEQAEEWLSRLPLEMFEERAQQSTKLSLLVNQIVERHQLKVDQARVDQEIERMASTYEDPQQVIDYYRSNEQQLSQIQSEVLQDQVIDLVLESAQVKDKRMPYEEAVRPEPAASSSAGSD